MSEITITFTISQNNALLLMVLYDILTDEEGDYSVNTLDYFQWLLDEIEAKQNDVFESIKGYNGELPRKYVARAGVE